MRIHIELGPPRKLAKLFLWVGIPCVASICIVAAVWAASFTQGESLSSSKMNSLIVPTGAVVPFNLSACPTGWTAYAPLVGRVPLGVAVGATTGTAGGGSTVTLATGNLPPHSHAVAGNYVEWGPVDGLHFLQGPGGFYGIAVSPPVVGNNDSAGSMKSTPITLPPPPNVGLLYCQKS